MVNAIDRIENTVVKEWYKNHFSDGEFGFLITNLEKKGYILDPNSGLLFRDIFSPNIMKEMNCTAIDIAFLRPVDWHYHEDVHEDFVVLSGTGEVIRELSPEENDALARNQPIQTCVSKKAINDSEPISTKNISAGDKVYWRKNFKHSLAPGWKDCLEVRLVCSGILNPEKEVCVYSFDKFEVWQKRFP